jgi:Lrp/AsnC family transcriptional regulator, leucine-responsive regulatory protein
MKLDSTDKAILNVLIQDGRASLREVAARTSLTTPTVSARLGRMQKGGLIRGFVPVLDPGMSQGVRSFVSLRIPAKDIETAAKTLSRRAEVDGVFLTVGGGNLLVRLNTRDLEGVEEFVGRRLGGRGWAVVSTEVVERTVKDERAIIIPDSVILPLKCDYCGQQIKSERPFNIRVGLTRHYFCCNTCRKSYLADHRGEIEAARRKAKRETLRS